MWTTFARFVTSSSIFPTLRRDAYQQVDRLVGDLGLPLVQVPYTGMGFLISRYAGVERTVMLSVDEPDELEQTVATINAAHEKVTRLMADGPSQVLFHSDNLSADVQSPRWLERYSGSYYRRMAQIAHEHGKPLVTHIDGRLRGLLRSVGEMGIDGADAVTPRPGATSRRNNVATRPDRGSCSPEACRQAVSRRPCPWKCSTSKSRPGSSCVGQSPALILAPGDQLPPTANWSASSDWSRPAPPPRAEYHLMPLPGRPSHHKML